MFEPSSTSVNPQRSYDKLAEPVVQRSILDSYADKKDKLNPEKFAEEVLETLLNRYEPMDVVNIVNFIRQRCEKSFQQQAESAQIEAEGFNGRAASLLELSKQL